MIMSLNWINPIAAIVISVVLVLSLFAMAWIYVSPKAALVALLVIIGATNIGLACNIGQTEYPPRRPDAPRFRDNKMEQFAIDAEVDVYKISLEAYEKDIKRYQEQVANKPVDTLPVIPGWLGLGIGIPLLIFGIFLTIEMIVARFDL